MENKFGFGLMRLPKDADGHIDIARVSRMADAFLAGGFTYFDTAYVYAGAEEAFREAVAKRHPRESYTIASKMAAWLCNDSFPPEEMFRQSLERCGVTYFDYYLLHSLQPSRVGYFDKLGCWDFCLRKKAEGKIRNFGFSFHGAPDLLDELLTKHPEVDFVQLQLNYVDWDSTAIWSGENYEVCRRHNKPVVVMEPVKGGILANLAPPLAAKLDAVRPGASPASFALRFVAGLPGVMKVLSGMGSEEQMADNLATFTHFEPLSAAEQAAVAAVKDALLATDTVPCTDCHYCVKGCPKGIRIPEIFKSLNMVRTFGDHSRPHLYYNGQIDTGSGRAKDCIRCGQCEAACPQHLPIIELLKQASAAFDK